MSFELSRIQHVLNELASPGLIGFALTGSHARGEAQPYSDIDLWRFVQVMPPEPAYTLRWVADHLLSITTATLESQYAKLQDPGGALSAVPGLRQMRILSDNTGEILALKDAALRFQWAAIQEQANQCASNELLGYAEEAHKLMNALAQPEDYRLLYALHGLIIGLSQAVALYKGVLSESENTFWRQVQLAVGDDSAWTQSQRLALGLLVATPRARAEAGLRLYRETAALLEPIILPQHRVVIEATVNRIAQFVY